MVVAAAAAGPAVGGLEDLEDLAPLGQAAAVDRCQQEAEAEAAEALRGNHQDTPWFVCCNKNERKASQQDAGSRPNNGLNYYVIAKIRYMYLRSDRIDTTSPHHVTSHYMYLLDYVVRYRSILLFWYRYLGY